MLKRYTFWLTAAVIFQLLNAVLHSISFFVDPPAKNETERQMVDLLNNYKFDLGAGFHRTFSEMFIALSSCFTFVCLLGGLTLGYLLLKHAGTELMRGIVAINLLVFGGMFVVMTIFTFLPPIILCGLIFINLLAAFLTMPKTSNAV